MDIPSQAVFAPDISSPPSYWKDASSWHFECFALYTHEQHCLTCSSVHRWSEPYRMFTKRYAAAIDRQFVPADRIPSSFSVVTYAMPVKTIPLCHHCLTSDRIGQQTILVSNEHAWNEAQRRSREALESGRRSAGNTSTKPLPNLEDLL